MLNRKQLVGNMMLLLTAIIWGFAFVAQRVGMEHIGPFTFTAARFLMGAIVLTPFIYFSDKRKAKALAASGHQIIQTEEEKKAVGKTLMIGGVACGCALFVASSLQQTGLVYTTAGKAGFITALYIVLVPIFGLFLKKKVAGATWIGVALSAVGLYLLCVKEGLNISVGDLIVFVGAFFWSAHILIIDHFSPKVDGVRLSRIQFIVCGMLALVPTILLERPSMAALQAVAVPLLYSGILSCGVAYTLQILAQKDTDPAIASLLLSTEALFGAIGGFLFLNEILTIKELIGCALMFAAIIIAQMPQKPKEDPAQAPAAQASIDEDQVIQEQ